MFSVGHESFSGQPNGRGECVDAFIVALNRTCDGGEQRWYASTLELQPVSLEFCVACRRVPTSHSTSTVGRLVSGVSRAPVVRAYSLTWALSMDVLLQSCAMELQRGSKYRRSGGHSSAANLASMLWLQRLKRLVLELDTPVITASWPASLQQLSFGYKFNKPIADVVWPASLQHLSFGLRFNQPIANIVWPASLQHLSFGYTFNQPIAEAVWPASLQVLSFGNRFNQPITTVVWPASLQQVSLGRMLVSIVQGASTIQWGCCHRRETPCKGFLQANSQPFRWRLFAAYATYLSGETVLVMY
ncbi:unnamed protein product [Ectocarpus sp. CCAP 1310/34]|nr:unnamed protein product [Ectocarpus sp. CCAP 1310/34]